MKKVIFVIVLVALGFGAYVAVQYNKAAHPYTKQEEKDMKEKSSQVAIEYFKREKNWDIKVTKVEFSGSWGVSSIFVSGYVKENGEEVSAIIDYKNNYEVSGVTVSKKLHNIEGRK
ncbi:hypothetical protein [Bacillus cereus group sp. BfR-BA-01380]|uniref:hypothetical protein n=1 Tax=Bacillus cereus group sp. BfR-BA-01380 TaxID=2920324 RepID=UPI001F5A4B17|nr:hypothetical protein [Bacillus cereus group sp. BfR-BA-01380]